LRADGERDRSSGWIAGSGHHHAEPFREPPVAREEVAAFVFVEGVNPMGAVTDRIFRPGSCAGTAWRPEDDADLRKSLEAGCSIETTAEFLLRTPEECRARLDELDKTAQEIFPRDIAAS
jgi:hypothetical protein